MRDTNVVVVALALGLAGLTAPGCRSLGFYNDAEKDWSANNTREGTHLDLDPPESVMVQKFAPDLKGAAPSVKVSLKNEGDLYDIFSVDVEFGYPAPEGSFAPYNPEFVSVDIANFNKGDVKDVTVLPPQGVTGMPLFARIVTTRGSEVRMTTGQERNEAGAILRQGTRLLQGRVEVVAVGGDLVPEKPTISFTLENVDSKEPGKPIGDLQYNVTFYKNGAKVNLGRRLSGLKPVGKPLGEKGQQVTIEVAYTTLEAISLAGARPVLRVTQ